MLFIQIIYNDVSLHEYIFIRPSTWCDWKREFTYDMAIASDGVGEGNVHKKKRIMCHKHFIFVFSPNV